MSVAYFDTNILIDFFAGHASAKIAMERFTIRRLPAVAYIELMTGLKTSDQRARVDEVIGALFEVVHTDMAVCREAALLRQKLGLKLPDALVYATARVGKAVLVTRDRDFNENLADIHRPY